MKKLITFILAASIISFSGVAQNPSSPENFLLSFVPVGNVNENLFNNPNLDFKDKLVGADVKITAQFNVADLQYVDKIYFRLLKKENGNIVFEDYFAFDNYEVGEVQEYYRNDKRFKITLGVFNWSKKFYCELWTESNQGQKSEVMTYSIDN